MTPPRFAHPRSDPWRAGQPGAARRGAGFWRAATGRHLGGKRIREQEDEVTKLRQPVVPLRADVAGPPPAYRPIGHLYDRGDVDLGDAEGFQGIDDLAGLDRPVRVTAIVVPPQLPVLLP